MSSRCRVYLSDDEVKKFYFSQASMDSEKEVYHRLKGHSFIPGLLDEDANSITIERIKAPTLTEYVGMFGKLPDNVSSALKYIKETMVDAGIVDSPDFYKIDSHIFVDSPDNSPETGGIRIIDFDVDLVVPKDSDSVRFAKRNIEREFAFLNNIGDSSWDEFRYQLLMGGVSGEVLDAYKKQLEN